ncbi:hypothetical protein FA743_18045 [Paracoccus gahaiensis]|uniref:Uncharacterized protein n=1 Tax=Paracoccus gahaiensis TaxID=1706839 RepID=A0A4U0R4F4_9RHOB|nr:hypothetical protein FA743_18045 [Paracoccus gahaiensis]
MADLRGELGKSELARAAVHQAKNQDLRDKIARLKDLPPRPPFKPSGMEKASNRDLGKEAGTARRRGPTRQRLYGLRNSRIDTAKATPLQLNVLSWSNQVPLESLVRDKALISWRRLRISRCNTISAIIRS